MIEARGKGLLLAFEFITTGIGYTFTNGMFDRGVLVASTVANAKSTCIEPFLTILAVRCQRGLVIMPEAQEAVRLVLRLTPLKGGLIRGGAVVVCLPFCNWALHHVGA